MAMVMSLGSKSQTVVCPLGAFYLLSMSELATRARKLCTPRAFNWSVGRRQLFCSKLSLDEKKQILDKLVRGLVRGRVATSKFIAVSTPHHARQPCT